MYMRLFTGWFALLLITGSHALAAEIRAARSGLWSASSTWAGGAVPGPKDTINIDRHTVTVNDARVAGASGPAGSIAIRIGGNGKIVIASGGVLAVRGDTVYAGGPSTRSEVLVVEAGGTWKFDGSQAAHGTRYSFHPESDAGFRRIRLAGTAAARATLTSDPGGANGNFNLKTPAGGVFIFSYGDVSRIGDAATPAMQIGYEFSGDHMAVWDVSDTRFTSCGTIQSVTAMGVDDDGTFRHNRNVHEHTLAPAVFTGWINISSKYKAGLREIHGNVFDVSLSRTQFYLPGFTVWGNYFGDSTQTGGGPWKSFQGNFLRFTDWWAQTASSTALMGDVKDTYIFVDSDSGNAKPTISNGAITGNLLGVIFGQGGTGKGAPGGADSGELFFNVNPEKPTAYAVKGSIVLPNMNGYGSVELGAWGGFPNLLGVAEHNTWMGGFPGTSKDGANGNFGFPALQMGEGYKPKPGQIVSFKSNILWNPQLPGKTAGFAKLADIANGWNDPDPTTDICAPQACDHNAGWGYTATNPAAKQYTNQGKGYVAKFSKTPGAHDVDVDPMFVDYQRTVELFDSRYLGNKADAWSASAAYRVGAFVQHSTPDVYWNLPVNYRYVNAGTCAGTNPEPGKGAKWRECWEWASLFRLREAIASGRKFDDQKIGVHGEDAIMTLIAWIRAGYSPTNSRLAGAAHDGGDIGAVPVTFPPQGAGVQK
jgi:hypothetical protein